MHHKNGASAIADLRMSGCLKVLFSRARAHVDAIVINSSGGLTSGDSFSLKARVQKGATAAITTQAAERAYRAVTGPAHVQTDLSVARDAGLLWLPQELILFDGSALERRLRCDLETGAGLLLVEPVIFGRARMGEELNDLWFSDRIEINRNGAPLFRDSTHIKGDIQSTLRGTATLNHAGAMASVVYIQPDAAAQKARLLAALPSTAGASLLADDVLVMRILAEDGFELRRSLLPILDRLTDNTLPTSWRL